MTRKVRHVFCDSGAGDGVGSYLSLSLTQHIPFQEVFFTDPGLMESQEELEVETGGRCQAVKEALGRAGSRLAHGVAGGGAVAWQGMKMFSKWPVSRCTSY